MIVRLNSKISLPFLLEGGNSFFSFSVTIIPDLYISSRFCPSEFQIPPLIDGGFLISFSFRLSKKHASVSHRKGFVGKTTHKNKSFFFIFLQSVGGDPRDDMFIDLHRMACQPNDFRRFLISTETASAEKTVSV